MLLRITLSLLGENFKPEEIIPKFIGECIVSSSHYKGERFGRNLEKTCQGGAVSLWNPQKYEIPYHGEEYEEWFIVFIENNYQLFLKSGVEEIRLHFEVFTLYEQCNFEVFNNHLLKRLVRYNVSLPMSVYVLTEAEMIDLKKSENIGEEE